MSFEAAKPPSKAVLWTGRIISFLVVAMCLLGAYMSITKNPQAVQGTQKLGLPETVMVPLGIVQLVCALLYALPFTSVLGAVLLTGWLGGAVFAHLSAKEPVYAPIIFGVAVWAGLFLRDHKLRTMIPLRR